MFVCKKAELTEMDLAKIKLSELKLPVCPICGKRAYVSHDIADGADYGWSVGCSAAYMNDGIHTQKMSRFMLRDEKECVKWWLNKVQEIAPDALESAT
jgi:hypothetical protein